MHPTCCFRTGGGADATTGSTPGTSTRLVRAAPASEPETARCSSSTLSKKTTRSSVPRWEGFDEDARTDRSTPPPADDAKDKPRAPDLGVTKANFQSLYLGNCSAVVATLRDQLPELNLTRADCREMSWVQYVAYIYFGDASNSTPLETLLLNRTMTLGRFYKNKSDYVTEALTKDAWEKIFTWPSGAAEGQLVLEPQGGRMGSIAADDTPFPHRAGVLYNIQYLESWVGGNNTTTPSWINTIYDFMEPLVSKNPRAAYANYRDLDLGVNQVVGGVSTYESGKVWGERYFGGNFQRLAMIKRNVDAGDYFRNEQSVPPLLS
ncbi:berberine bridge enzyme-like Cyn d 4 [Lolium rigidum]|uniref:berberine bridge enzyme-like Cyn d 4 n=1 Tax=Lolium rigidum TaxID=89674 RepID=UPI001F5CEA98|nr:berberine bridge enzyme-like Cyn d 4 [Lolium rigidum]